MHEKNFSLFFVLLVAESAESHLCGVGFLSGMHGNHEGLSVVFLIDYTGDIWFGKVLRCVIYAKHLLQSIVELDFFLNPKNSILM